MSEVHATMTGILADLARLGGVTLTTETTRAPLTWSAQSIRTQAEYDHDKITGAHGPTGRHQSSVTLLVTVRDFSLLPAVAVAMTKSDSVEIHSVSWSVDDDNAEWALVRADAIHAALRKGRDYAAALGGTVASVDHVADAGLLGGDNPGWTQARAVSFGAAATGGEEISLDPVPQVLSATIEARFTATVSALPPR